MLTPTSKSAEEREVVVDSGASMHMLSKKVLNSRWIGYFAKIQEPSVVLTANGEVHAKEEAHVYVHDLNLFVTVQLLEETLAVLSLWKPAKTTDIPMTGSVVKNHGWPNRDNCMQNGQLRTSCCSRVIQQFWEQFVVNIDIAGFVYNKSSSRAKWPTSPTKVVRITFKNPHKIKKRDWQSRCGRPFARSSWMVGRVDR